MARTACSVPVVIAWNDEDGADRLTRGVCLEVSETGLRVSLPQPIPYLSYVTLRLDGPGLAVAARVRHVRRQGLRAVIGLELRLPLGNHILDAIEARSLAKPG